jgi:hypothetical protein
VNPAEAKEVTTVGHRTAAILVVIILLIAVARTQVSAQDAPVQLRLVLKSGDAIFYALSRTSTSTLEIFDRQSSSERRFEAQEALRVLDVSDDGSAVVEWVWENSRVNGGPCGCVDAPLVMRLRPDGAVTEVRVGDEQPDTYLLRLPARPVAVGESWQHKTTGEVPLTYTFTLASVNRAGDERVAVIRYTVSGGFSDRTRRVTLRARGEAQWSVDRGRILRSTEEFTLDTLLYAGSVTVRQTLRSTERREPFVGTVPATETPDRLISPGKGIGDMALTMTVEELAARYGGAERAQREGFRAAGVTWLDPRAPRGYVDESDPPKLLGLETADESYQTEKGMRYGSSEGAVLFAYGREPVRVEMSVSGHGGVRMLIYDDQGIAFAITSDKGHADHTGRHAPVGAVDWIIVFAPGDAGKIFQLP